MKLKKYHQFLEAKSDMWDVIPQSIKDLNSIFSKAGKKLYLVGGSVRDFLTGDKPKDFDLATDALPDEVIKILQSYNYDFNLQGKAFGVVVAYTNDQPDGLEIATFRQDISKGRNPEVKLGVTIEDDVKRRDLTYNSLFYDLEKREVVDLVGGKKDLEKGVTRMVGDPVERFDEDSLRILRAFRFASRYGHPLHKDTEKAIEKRKQLSNIDSETGKIKRISAERIWEEFKKAWSQAKDFNNYLNFFTKFEMWEEVFPDAFITAIPVDSKDFIVVVSNLFKWENPNELSKKLVDNYKIESDIANKVEFLVRLQTFKPDLLIDMYKMKVQCHIKDSTILEWLDVCKISDPLTIKFVDWKPTISGSELLQKGFKGKELGEEMKKLEVEKFTN